MPKPPRASTGADRGSEDIVVRDNPAQHRFEAASAGGLATAEYELRGTTITFTHTLVPGEMRGRGIATRLVIAGLAAARERGLRVVPQCPFFAAHFRGHPELGALLAPEGRALLGL
jgi:predicted GNAT family acetyltransferase